MNINIPQGNRPAPIAGISVPLLRTPYPGKSEHSIAQLNFRLRPLILNHHRISYVGGGHGGGGQG